MKLWIFFNTENWLADKNQLFPCLVKLLGQDAVQFSYFFGLVGGWGGVVGEVRYRANLSQS